MMKKRIQNYIPVIMMTGILVTLATGCKKDDENNNVKDPVQKPELETIALSGISENAVSYVGLIISNGGAEITACGICWGTDPNPTIDDNNSTAGTGTSSFSGTIGGLTAGESYYVRVYATNSAGTGYSNEQSFSTLAETVTDIDGNVYHTVTIGTQVWMAENLRTTKYRDGTPIRNVSDNGSWFGINYYGAYCDYNNDQDKGQSYGHLYNWYAASDSRNIAPEGWHVPSDDDFLILANYLGGINNAGGKLKEAGYAHWLSPNSGATNETGFNAIPGGARNPAGFILMGEKSGWWTTSESNEGEAYIRYVAYYNPALTSKILSKLFGNSIRCVKD
jgi:uncharacterized protein (TIGR02145 family)